MTIDKGFPQSPATTYTSGGECRNSYAWTNGVQVTSKPHDLEEIW